MASDRVLAETVCAPRPVPGHANAAVDGYTFAYASYDADNGSNMPIGGRAAAGSSAITRSAAWLRLQNFYRCGHAAGG